MKENLQRWWQTKWIVFSCGLFCFWFGLLMLTSNNDAEAVVGLVCLVLSPVFVVRGFYLMEDAFFRLYIEVKKKRWKDELMKKGNGS